MAGLWFVRSCGRSIRRRSCGLRRRSGAGSARSRAESGHGPATVTRPRSARAGTRREDHRGRVWWRSAVARDWSRRPPDGTVLGVDVSEDQFAAARRACTGVSNVRAEVGSAEALDADDGCFDASVSTQVLEYIEDVGVALAELARVTRVGGRIRQRGDHLGLALRCGRRRRLTERIIGGWDCHAPHPNLPVALPNHLSRAGFSSVLQTPLPLANRTFNRSTFAFGIANLMAAFAVAAGAIDDQSSRSWLSSLDEASRRGDLFISVMPMMTTATRAESTCRERACCRGRAENYDTDGRTQSTRPADAVIVVLGPGYRVSGERVKMHLWRFARTGRPDRACGRASGQHRRG